MLKAYHADFRKQEKRFARGTALGRVNVDLVYFSNEKFPDCRNLNGDFVETRKLLPRIYMYGRHAIWCRNGHISINYLLGVSRAYEKIRKIDVMFGLGFGYVFNKRGEEIESFKY